MKLTLILIFCVFTFHIVYSCHPPKQWTWPWKWNWAKLWGKKQVPNQKDYQRLPDEDSKEQTAGLSSHNEDPKGPPGIAPEIGQHGQADGPGHGPGRGPGHGPGQGPGGRPEGPGQGPGTGPKKGKGKGQGQGHVKGPDQVPGHGNGNPPNTDPGGPADDGNQGIPHDPHTFLFDTKTITNIAKGQPPTPLAPSSSNRWTNHHVKMPCPPFHGNDDAQATRWNTIVAQLSNANTWTTAEDLEKAIKAYNSPTWNFKELKNYTNQLNPAEKNELFTKTLPAMATLAMKLPQLIAVPIPLLKKGTQQILSMTQEQAACILANAFFCTFPTQPAGYPPINFSLLFRGGRKFSNAKLKFIFHYFQRVTTKVPEGVVSYERFSPNLFPEWSNSQAPLTKLQISLTGTIEDNGQGAIEVDFANKRLGGGTLGNGAVQEEIMFLIHPEMIVGMLFTEEMNDDECVFITGCERYSSYSGYADTLQFQDTYVDNRKRDSSGRKLVTSVAIDALEFHQGNLNDQFKIGRINRELNKAYCGFGNPNIDKIPVATGHWGCGAFNGDKQLKAIIQLLAASQSGRDVIYFAFKDQNFANEFSEFYNHLVNRHKRVGDIYTRLQRFNPSRTLSLFDFIKNI